MPEESDKDDWQAVRFRPRHAGTRSLPDDDARARFVYGAILFVAVALAYPWYSYWVQSRLLAADVNRALTEAEKEVRAAVSQVEPALDYAGPAAMAPVRPHRPRILGVSEGAATSVIVADLDGESLDAAEPKLCVQAAGWIRRPTAGMRFRVQSFRRSEPALTVGSIRC